MRYNYKKQQFFSKGERKMVKKSFFSIFYLVLILILATELYAARFNLIAQKRLDDKEVVFYTKIGDLDGDGVKEIISYKVDNEGQKIEVSELAGTIIERKTVYDVVLNDTTDCYLLFDVYDIDSDNKDEIIVTYVYNARVGVKVLELGVSGDLVVIAEADIGSAAEGIITGLAPLGADIYVTYAYLNPEVINATGDTLPAQPFKSDLYKLSFANGALSSTLLGSLDELAYQLKIVNNEPVFAGLSVNIDDVNKLIEFFIKEFNIYAPGLQRSAALKKFSAGVAEILSQNNENLGRIGNLL